MQKSFVGKSARIALGIALVLGVGCGGSSSHPNPDGSDGSKDSKTGSAGVGGADGGAGTGATDAGGTTGTAGADGGAGTGATDAGGTTGTAGADGGAGTGATDAGGTTGTTDGGAGTTDAGSDSPDASPDTVGDGGVSDASDAAAPSDADDAGDVACTNACTLAATRCGPNGGTQTCVMGSSTCTVWGTEATCGAHKTCAVTGAGAACACSNTECTVAGDFCASGTTKSTCSVDTDGCFFVAAAPVACGTRQSCTGAAGAASCTCNVDPSCAHGADTFCASTTSQSNCGTDTDGCFFVASTTPCASAQTCSGSAPSGSCQCNPAPAQCTADGLTFCDSNGHSETCTKDAKGCYFISNTTTCGTHQTCNGSGVCACNASACSGAGTFCDGSGKLVTCAVDANSCSFVSAGPTSCAANETCTGASPTAACTCNAAPAACTGGAPGTFCSSGTETTTCVADAHSCVTIATTHACGTRQTCGGTSGANSCVCNAPPAGCTAAGTFCMSTGVQEDCVADADSCLFAQNATACPAHETCKGSTIGSTCTCDNTCTAAQAGGTYCIDGATQATCTNDSNSCHTSSATVTCQGTQTCRTTGGAGGACQCPAAGVVAGTGCATLNATICQGNTVLTCTLDALGACNVWAAPNDCTAGGYVCGTKSGVAACQCVEHTGTAYYADPANGTSSTSGVFATGITSPEACRFTTLTTALANATNGNQVVAKSDAPAKFQGETFPLVVGTGVTLTTDAPLTPSTYTIVFNGNGSAVTLGTNSVLEGFTIANNNGGAASTAVLVPSTGVSIDTVVLEGTGTTVLANGIALTGTGQAIINNANISGFTTGVNVATSSPTVQLNNSNLSFSGTNLLITNGTVSASTDVITDGTTNVSIAAAGTNLPTLNGTTLLVTSATGAGISQTSTGGTPSLTISGTNSEISHNGGGGITSGAGSVTVGTANIHDNTGSGVSATGGSVSITGPATIQANTVKGISFTGTGTTLEVGNMTVTGNGSDGLFASAGAVTVDTGAHFDSNTGEGLNVSTKLTFNGTAAAPTTASHNTGDGLSVSAGTTTASYLTLDSNGVGNTAIAALKVTGTGVINLGTATDSALLFQNSGGPGINIAGTAAGSAVSVTRATIKTNGGDGIAIDLNGGNGAGAASASITASTISGNASNGVEVTRAPLGSSVVKLLLDGLTVSGNTGNGVWLRGNSGNVGASLTNSKLTGNTLVGLRVQQGSTTQETIQGNDINSNSGGGITFNTSSTLTSFQANSVHGNAGDQIIVSAAQNIVLPAVTPAAWPFRSVGNACDANENKIYAYTNPGVGLRANAAAGATVDAENVSWAHSAPSAGTDYVATGTNVVTVSLPCTASP
jgi:Right handed beta helix region